MARRTTIEVLKQVAKQCERCRGSFKPREQKIFLRGTNEIVHVGCDLGEVTPTPSDGTDT